jgi:putative autotransporter adhesin-like protein
MAIVSAPHHDRQAPHRTKPQMAAFTTLLILAAIGVVLLARDVLPGSSRSSGVQGSGVAATSTRALPNFSGIDLAGSNNVTVVAGARQSVVVHADSNLLSHVTTQVKAGTLIIGGVGSFNAKSPMYVEISVPSLAALDLSGSGNITVTGIRASRLTVTLPGSGNIYASGSVTQLNISIDGSGDAQFSGLITRNVEAVVGGSGSIFVTATQSLDAKVPGSGAILYSGNPPHVTTSITGSGAVTPG